MSSALDTIPNVGVSAGQLVDFARQHNLSELAIFGSVLRDDFRGDSDVDVLYELLPGDHMSIEKYLAMKDGLEALFARPVDLVRKSLLRNPYRRAAILNTRRVVYAA